MVDDYNAMFRSLFLESNSQFFAGKLSLSLVGLQVWTSMRFSKS